MSEHLHHTAAAPNAATIERLAHEAVKRLPDTFRQHLEDVVFRVQDFADSAMLGAVGVANPWDLIGLYQGRPLTQQSIWSGCPCCGHGKGARFRSTTWSPMSSSMRSVTISACPTAIC
jgi:hypothetical protein